MAAEPEPEAEKVKVHFDKTPRSDATGSQLGGRKAKNPHEGLVGANQTLFRRVGGQLEDAIGRKPATNTEKADLSQAPTAAGTVQRRESFNSINQVTSGRRNTFNKTSMSNIVGETE